MNQLSAKEALEVAKALKEKYRIPITDIIRCNYSDFYNKIKNGSSCDQATENQIFAVLKNKDEDLDSFKNIGSKILEEERKFKSIEWNKIILGIRKKLNLTQKELAEILKVQKSRISDWECNKKNPSYENCKKIYNFILDKKLNLNELLEIGSKGTKRKRPSDIPCTYKINENLAELVGILNGDGSISKAGLITISGSVIEDIEYQKKYVSKLIQNIFSKKATIKSMGPIVKTSFTSLKIAKFFSKLKLPLGKKISIEIPDFAQENNTYLKCYLRGIFDTDGSVCKRNKWNIRINLGSFADNAFTLSLRDALQKLKFSSNKRDGPENRSAIEISNDLDVIRFFQIIGSSNPSKIARFLYWKLEGYCPKENYQQIKQKLKTKFNLNLNDLKLPFFWNEKYLNSLTWNNKSVLLEKLREDLIKLKFNKQRGKIDWKNIMKKLRTQFKLKELTSELQCSYKTIWQWQKGRRKPNLKMLVRIVKFCNKNKINLENLSP
jgi:transcriptional regulator with XRE-family HTH domain